MKVSIGATLAGLRKGKKLMQKDVAAKMSDYGFKVGAKTIYNWEKGLAQPSIPHFLALCDMLDVDDALWQFAGMQKGPYSGLNTDGRKKAREFIDLLLLIDKFRVMSGDSDDSHDRNAPPDQFTPSHQIAQLDQATKANQLVPPDQLAPPHQVAPPNQSAQPDQHKQNDRHSESLSGSPRILRLYDIPVSAGTGNFLDDSSYEEIEAPSYIPVAVDFALRVSGDSMEPLIRDGQVIWVREQEVLDSGDIGIFTYAGDVYCKKLVVNGVKAYLRSLNPAYEDIKIEEDFGFKVIGKVVS